MPRGETLLASTSNLIQTQNVAYSDSHVIADSPRIRDAWGEPVSPGEIERLRPKSTCKWQQSITPRLKYSYVVNSVKYLMILL